MRLLAAITGTILCSFQPIATQAGSGTVLGPTIVEGSQWRGSFVLSQPTSNIRVRYSSSHCAPARQYARTILAITESGRKYNNVWMAVERSKGGVVEAASFTPPFDLPPGTYSISVEGKTDSGKPHKLAVCVGVGEACAQFESLDPPAC